MGYTYHNQTIPDSRCDALGIILMLAWMLFIISAQLEVIKLSAYIYKCISIVLENSAYNASSRSIPAASSDFIFWMVFEDDYHPANFDGRLFLYFHSQKHAGVDGIWV